MRMNIHPLLRPLALCLAASLLTIACSPRLNGQLASWTWKDKEGTALSKGDFEKIASENRLWVESGGKAGKWGDFRFADFHGVDFVGMYLRRALFSGADLSNATLDHADFTGACFERFCIAPPSGLRVQVDSGPWTRTDESTPPPLVRADPERWVRPEESAQLMSASLEGTILVSAFAENVDFRGADLESANLRNALLRGSNFSATDFRHANLAGAIMVSTICANSNMSDADLTNVDFSGASLVDADARGSVLKGVRFKEADVRGLVFEPDVLPGAADLASARNLEEVTYRDNPEALSEMRKKFKEAGFAESERQITYALNRRQTALDSPINGFFRWVAFDLTCQYGMSPFRPLLILAAIWASFSTVYSWFILSAGKSRLRVVVTHQHSGSTELGTRDTDLSKVLKNPKWSYPFRWLVHERRVLYAGCLFSLRSALAIKVGDMDLGNWVKTLTHGQYEFRAEGWARTIAGLQFLLSALLILLFAWVTFGTPFE